MTKSQQGRATVESLLEKIKAAKSLASSIDDVQEEAAHLKSLHKQAEDIHNLVYGSLIASLKLGDHILEADGIEVLCLGRKFII